MDDSISRSILRLKGRAPFFSVLALHARRIADPTIGTAATDGQSLRYAPAFLDGLEPHERDFVVAHEVSHLALRHVRRRGPREPLRWNLACDIVVNGMLIRHGLRPPSGTVRDRELEDLRAEDAYARLPEIGSTRRKKLGAVVGSGLRDLADEAVPICGGSDPEEGWWRDVLRKAAVVQRTTGAGPDPLTASLELGAVLEPMLDWRTLLWRHLVRSPTDFVGYDRRFVHRGLYLDALDGERVEVRIAVDTSGSISHQLLTSFVAEIRGILAAHPQLNAQLWFADTRLYGPHALDRDGALPEPVGGGGTDLRPFFAEVRRVTEAALSFVPPVLVYLTDGLGPIPDRAPPWPTLWVVPDGGRDHFPWGDVARLEDPR